MAIKLNQSIAQVIAQKLSYCTYVDIYTGTQPASPDDAPPGTKLVTIIVEFDSNGADYFLYMPPYSGTAIASGTAGWARVRTSDGSESYDGVCGLVGSGAEVIMDSLDVVSGNDVTISTFNLSVPLG